MRPEEIILSPRPVAKNIPVFGGVGADRWAVAPYVVLTLRRP
jgi:hypothetical protein